MWIRRELAIYLGWLITAVVFAAVFFAYSLPAGPLLYAAGLTFFVLMGVSAFRYFYWRKRIRLIEECKESIDTNQMPLPTPTDKAEMEYREIITRLQAKLQESNYAFDRNLVEMRDYYSIWAHQIKTPIAALRLILQTEQLPQYNEIGDQLSRIEEYVEMVMGFIRSEGISGDLLLREYNLDTILKQAIKKHAKTFIRKKITLNYEPVDLFVVTDEKWLTFVIEQILSNALKYTSSGKISVFREAGSVDTLVISDEGTGIAACDLPRIFEKGFTGFNGRQQSKSTGIGLYLCHKILVKLSHTIEIESEEGVGTVVKIKFPQQSENWE